MEVHPDRMHDRLTSMRSSVSQPASHHYLIQKLSVTVQRGNAAAIFGSMGVWQPWKRTIFIIIILIIILLHMYLYILYNIIIYYSLKKKEKKENEKLYLFVIFICKHFSLLILKY